MNILKYVSIMLLGIFLATTAYADMELYIGHSIRGASTYVSDDIIGFNVGKTVKTGAGRFGDTWYAHVILETPWEPFFVGLGVGAVDYHECLGGHIQITSTAGWRWDGFVLRWMHMSNAANIFQHGDDEAQRRNKGIDFLTFGIMFD